MIDYETAERYAVQLSNLCHEHMRCEIPCFLTKNDCSNCLLMTERPADWATILGSKLWKGVKDNES